jgi:hypothetical protein
MNQASPIEQIRERIKNSEHGSIYVPSDFTDLADYSTVKVGLSRLVESGMLRRVIRGIYEYPEYSDFLKEFVSTSAHKVALALARNYSWTIVPDGDTALNQLGLSTQVPAEWTYVSNGPYKKYSFNKTTIRFKRTASKDILKLSYKSALLVQAIKATGKERLDAAYMKNIARLMTVGEKSAILAEGQYMTAWIYDLVKKICGIEGISL